MDDENQSEEKFYSRVSLVATIGICAWVGALLLYLARFYSQPISDSADKWGQFGDYLGGVVNPIIGLATVVLIAMSLVTQRQELRATQNELKSSNSETRRMAFEQSFFSWLNSYQRLLDTVSTPRGPIGRRALIQWKNEYFDVARIGKLVYGAPSQDTEDVTSFMRHLLDHSIKQRADSYELNKLFEFFRLTLVNYQQAYSENRSDLDALFRTIFRLIKWIDQSTMPQEEKWHYVAIVRAQVSWIEYYYLLLNCLTDRGLPFCEYANKYSFFDNLEAGTEPVITIISTIFSLEPEILQQFSKNPWPLELRAFNSKLGRKALGIEETQGAQ